MQIKFREGLQLADLKARLIVARLSAIGEVIACEPSVDDIQSFEELSLFSLTLLTNQSIEQVRKIASVDGVEDVEIVGPPSAVPGPVERHCLPNAARNSVCSSRSSRVLRYLRECLARGIDFQTNGHRTAAR